jgi:hypothetical protein
MSSQIAHFGNILMAIARSFVTAIIANPGDDAPRLICALWR